MIGAVIAIARGTGVGSANQATYLVEPLRRAHVELFARDWFAMDTTHYHGAFVDLATELFRADDSGATAFGLAHVLAMVVTFGAVFAIAGVVVRRTPPLALLAILAGWIALGGSRAVGGSYLVATYFQPSSIATAAWLVALAAWLRDRSSVAGIALAVGGAFHANFLLLGVAWFAALELSARPRRPRRVLALVGPSLVVIAATIPALAQASEAADPHLALRVLVEFHAPAHYDARATIAQLPPLLGWLVAAWACAPERDPSLARAWRVALVGTAACALVFVAILIAPPVTRLFVWRIAPFAQLASQCVLLAVAFSDRALAPPGGRLGRWRALGLPVGGGVVLGWSIEHAGGSYTCALAATLATAVVYRLAARRETRWWRGVRRWAPAAAGVVALALAIVPVGRRLVARELFTEALGGRYRDVILWARTTDRDALFVVPPYADSFRLLARRAVVVDSRSPPLYPDELVAWYRRLCALVGVDRAVTHAEIEARYDRLGPDELMAIARRFDAQYIVIDKQRSRARVREPPAFEDWRIVVFAVR